MNTEGTDNGDGQEKKKVRIHYRDMNQDERIIYYRIKSAKIEKKQQQKFKDAKEMREFEFGKSNQKIQDAQRRKKIVDQEFEAKQQ